MAKKHFVAYSSMTKKQKVFNFLKVLGFSLAGVIAIVGAVVLYVYLKGDLIPGPVPLTDIYFYSSEADADGNRDIVNEYVIDGNKQISVTDDGNQIKENNNLVWEQKKDAYGNPIFDSIFVGANEGCTELDAVLTIDYHSNLTSPIIQVIEDENCSPFEKDEANPDKLYYKYNVKINSPIYIRPLTETIEINNSQVEKNIGGWVKITITQGQLYNSCWIFVDDPILDHKINVDESKFQKDESYDESNGFYNVYSNSVIDINQSFEPANALVLPSTSVPTSKGSTKFLKSKTVTYKIIPDDIAEIDSNGIITIKPNREGETFIVQAYVIAKYNDIGKEPNAQYDDPSQDETVIYNREFNKIRVLSNTITFKINEIAVQGISVEQPAQTPTFDVFEDGYITYSNTTTVSTSNNYSVDLTLTNNDDIDYKSTLLSNVKLFVGKVGEIVDGIPTAYSTNDFVIKETDINRYRKLVDASNYISLTKTANGTYHYVINNYSVDDFYFVFYYELGETTVTSILYKTVKFNLNKNDVTQIGVWPSNISQEQRADDNKITTITLNYNDEDDYEIYSIPEKLDVVLYGEDPTYTYVMYFVPTNNGIVGTYAAGAKAKFGIDNTIYTPVCAVIDGNLDFTKIITLGNGETKMYVAVVKTTTRYSGQDDIEFVYNADGFVEIERQYSINLEVNSTVRFSGIDYNQGLSDNVERVIKVIESDDPEYNFASDCQLFAEVYEEGKLQVDVSYLGDDDDVKNNRLQIELIYGTESTAKETVTVSGENGVYSFAINALTPGYAKFQIKYDGYDKYKVGIKVLSTELVGLKMATNDQSQSANSELNVSFEVEYGEASYTWNDLSYGIYFNSPKTESKAFELRTFALSEMFDEEFLSNFGDEEDSLDEKLIAFISLYQGKDFEEIIPNNILIENDIQTIQKLISKLTLSEDILKVYNTEVTEDVATDGEINIFDIRANANNSASFKFKVNSIGKVLVFAQSNDIYSNPILIETKCPEIKVFVAGNEITEKLNGEIYAYNELTSIDGYTTAQNQQNLLKDANGSQINFVAIVNNEEYNINNLIVFKFEEQTVSDDYYTSTASGAKISRIGAPILTAGDINSISKVENILATCDFGYRNSNFCQYTIVSDYKLQNTDTAKEYYTPSYVELFKGTQSILPNLVITNIDYDFEDITARVSNKLYLPKSFNISEIGNVFPQNFLNSFYYADPEDEDQIEYYHIYKVLTIANDGNNAQNYIVSGSSIKLQYKSDLQAIIIYIKTDANQIFNTSIIVKPGAVENFNNNYTVVAENLDGQPITIMDRLSFDCENGFEVNITDVNFGVNVNNNNDISYYYINDDEKHLETYVEVLSENIDYLTLSEYNALSESEKTGYKKFYYNISGIDGAYEEVYTNKNYFVEGTCYKVIPQAELNEAYMFKYYEAIYDDNEQIIDYQKTSDRQINNNKTYYYKLNHRELEVGEEVTTVFEKLVLTLSITKDSNNNVTQISIGYDTDLIKTITSEIQFNLTISATIKNGNASNILSGLYFNITLI